MIISIKKYITFFCFTWFSIILTCFFWTFLYYYDFVSDNVFTFSLFSSILISVFGNSFFLGKKSFKKGYLEGIKFGLLLIIPFALYSLILKKFYYRLFLYYFLMLLTAVFGSIVGINKKKLK